MPSMPSMPSTAVFESEHLVRTRTSAYCRRAWWAVGGGRRMARQRANAVITARRTQDNARLGTDR